MATSGELRSLLRHGRSIAEASSRHAVQSASSSSSSSSSVSFPPSAVSSSRGAPPHLHLPSPPASSSRISSPIRGRDLGSASDAVSLLLLADPVTQALEPHRAQDEPLGFDSTSSHSDNHESMMSHITNSASYYQVEGRLDLPDDKTLCEPQDGLEYWLLRFSLLWQPEDTSPVLRVVLPWIVISIYLMCFLNIIAGYFVVPSLFQGDVNYPRPLLVIQCLNTLLPLCVYAYNALVYFKSPHFHYVFYQTHRLDARRLISLRSWRIFVLSCAVLFVCLLCAKLYKIHEVLQNLDSLVDSAKTQGSGASFSVGLVVFLWAVRWFLDITLSPVSILVSTGLIWMICVEYQHELKAFMDSIEAGGYDDDMPVYRYFIIRQSLDYTSENLQIPLSLLGTFSFLQMLILAYSLFALSGDDVSLNLPLFENFFFTASVDTVVYFVVLLVGMFAAAMLEYSFLRLKWITQAASVQHFREDMFGRQRMMMLVLQMDAIGAGFRLFGVAITRNRAWTYLFTALAGAFLLLQKWLFHESASAGS
eukprot:CAMPEP_0174235316 /NCGR_PEP_ID=MMETSP0417-20130205/4801_1 /TAXON_ID=242541 /ORGANISM="Mayorella sp, Strain BSH-02190019" /LENGTH=533 /DNA_ID=CAMNT_0015313803 /DNA_START=45 /DNA_END=1643 /DNA_ORIENTATION=-